MKLSTAQNRNVLGGEELLSTEKTKLAGWKLTEKGDAPDDSDGSLENWRHHSNS